MKPLDLFFKADAFTRAYIECALWSSCDENGESCDRNEAFDVSNFALETIEKMITDCANFQAIADRWDAIDSQAGHDFWLTRNGHGAGFWDGDWPEHGEKLTAWAKTFGTCDLYLGDDGKVYLS